MLRLRVKDRGMKDGQTCTGGVAEETPAASLTRDVKDRM